MGQQSSLETAQEHSIYTSLPKNIEKWITPNTKNLLDTLPKNKKHSEPLIMLSNYLVQYFFEDYEDQSFFWDESTKNDLLSHIVVLNGVGYFLKCASLLVVYLSCKFVDLRHFVDLGFVLGHYYVLFYLSFNNPLERALSLLNVRL